MKVRIRTGDSLWYYSQMFMIPLNLMIDANPEVDPENLQIGQEVHIPGFIHFPYEIKEGDSFWKLAHRRNMSVDAIKLLNQSVDPQRLKIGEPINLPKRVITPVVNGMRDYDFDAMTEDIKQFKKIYSFIRVNSIGESVLGLPLTEIQIGKGPKKINLNASFHANEWITTPVLMTFMNDYLLSLTNGNPIRGIPMMPYYQSVELSIVAMVNPDGVNLVLNGPPENIKDDVVNINQGSMDFSAWKANIRGVDLNNQFPANWEIEKERKVPKNPAPRDYPGDIPLSEPEAIAMAKLAEQKKFDRLIALHTQGEEFYWGYEGLEPPESAKVANEFARVSGYKAVRYIDSHAGYKDWFIQEFRRSGFTLELGNGVNPLPIDQFWKIYDRMLPVFLASLYL